MFKWTLEGYSLPLWVNFSCLHLELWNPKITRWGLFAVLGLVFKNQVLAADDSGGKNKGILAQASDQILQKLTESLNRQTEACFSVLFCKRKHFTHQASRRRFSPLQDAHAFVYSRFVVWFNLSVHLRGRSSSPWGWLMKVLCNNGAHKCSSAAAFDSASDSEEDVV